MLTATRYYLGAAIVAATSFATSQKISDVGNLKLKDGEIAATKACEIAAQAAEGLGLGKFATKDFTALLRPVQGSYTQDNKSPREWFLVYPNNSRAYTFSIDTKSSELRGFEDMNLTWLARSQKSSKLGYYAATKQGLKAQVSKILNQLGIKPPAFMFLNYNYDHQGRILADTQRSPEASFYIASRHYSLILDRATGKLAKLEISRYGPPEDSVPDDLKKKVDYSRAISAATDFCQNIGFQDITKDQLHGSYSHINGSRHIWIFTHNRVYVYVDALTNAVTDFYNIGIEERLQKGDRYIARETEDLKAIVSKVGDKLNLGSQAQLGAQISHTWGKFGMSELPVLQGTYRIGNKEVARLTFDLYRGELISIQVNPNGLGPIVIN